MKKKTFFINIQTRLSDFLYPTLVEIVKDSEDEDIIVEIEVKEIRRFKKGGWIETK